MTASDPYGWIPAALDTIHRAQWYRTPPPIDQIQGRKIEVAGRWLLNFAGNDYLSLAQDPRLRQAAIAAITAQGTGSTGSRLVTGQRDLHRQLEEAIAAWQGTAAALVFSSGYLANVGTIAALVDHRDLVVADQYNHASLKMGAIASKAQVATYAHGQGAALGEILRQQRHQYRRCLIVTDSVFSMDGDVAPLGEILALAQTYDGMLLVDEAHGSGVLGATGAGAIEQAGLGGKPIVHMGTLSKALGSLGGYVAGSRPVVEFLRNRCSSWIYTTALSPADTGAALAAIEVVRSEPERRQRLWRNINYLRAQLQPLRSGRLLPSAAAVLCWELPNPQVALRVSAQLQEAGIFAPAIRPPTVPTSRIRLTVCAAHEIADLDAVIAAIGQIHPGETGP